MYDVNLVLQNLDNKLGLFLAFAAIGGICNWWLLIEGIRLGFKDRTHAISLICLLFWAAHDVSFVMLWQTYFIEIGHWVWILFWFNILGSVITELILFYQVVKFSGNEMFPGLSLPQRSAALLLLFALAMVVFWYLKLAMGGDTMSLYMMPLTIFLCPMFCIPIALKRQSQRGQSCRQSVIYMLLVVGIWPAWYLLDEAFRHPVFIALGVVTFLWSAANIAVLRKFPAYQV